MRLRSLSSSRRKTERAGTVSSAACEGVAARTSATRSAVVTSTSWPTPLTTGTRHAAIARATCSSSKAERSSCPPPPRAKMITSSSGTRERSANASRIDCGASSPCTVAWRKIRRTGMRERATSAMSCTAAPLRLVMIPTQRGQRGRGRFRPCSKRPSALSFCRRRSTSRARSPSPAGSATIARI